MTTFTPLLQTSFLPDLTQVYLYPFETVVALTLVQVPPALTAADAVTTAELATRAMIDSQSTDLFMLRV